MKYIIITHEDGRTQTAEIHANNVSHAHKIIANYCKATNKTAKIYTDTNSEYGLREGALTVVKRTTANMISREGGSLQFTLYNECRSKTINNPDVLDMLSECQLTLLQSRRDGLSIDEQYAAAYKAINSYLHSTRQIHLSVTAMRTVYIEDIDGDIISVNGTINKIINKDDKICYVDNMLECIDDVDSRARQIEQLHIIDSIAAILTPTQKDVLRYMAQGMSVRQIMIVMGRKSPNAIQQHIRLIRRKAQTLYPDGYKHLTD